LGTGYLQSEHDAIGLLLREPRERVSRFEESIVALRALLDHGTATFDGAHHTLAVADLGIRPLQARVPFLIGGHGRRVVGIAGRHADIFQFTGLTHGEGGVPGPGGFGLDRVKERLTWLADAAGDRFPEIELSLLVQRSYVGDDARRHLGETSTRFGLDVEVLERTPFVLMGSHAQVVDKVEQLRETLGVSHFVIREAEVFAPVQAALAGR
jgi:alkanesulfonate monooxygenase SsuD/methylene tetrahydromethanopterin reductase-like flavin-dependent oxidoreductase (luciferase family)